MEYFINCGIYIILLCNALLPLYKFCLVQTFIVIIFRALRRILPAIVFALYSCLFIIIIIITFQFSFSYKKDTV